MKNKNLIAALVCVVAIVVGYVLLHPPVGDVTAPQAQLIVDFYRGYLNSSNWPEYQKQHNIFSNSLNELIKQNRDICKQKAPDEVCGWGADSDPFISSQEYDGMTFENSKFTVTRVTDKEVDVKFIITPPEPGTEREIKFIVLQENGKWVVDDMTFKDESGQFDSAHSMRTDIRFEIDSFSPEGP